MKASITWHLILASAVPLLKLEASLAEELSVADRACITEAAAKLPQAAALKIEGSRAIDGRVINQPQSQGRRQWEQYRVKVEIDSNPATGHALTQTSHVAIQTVSDVRTMCERRA